VVVSSEHHRDKGLPPLEDCPQGVGRGPGPYAAIAARLQVLPEGLHLGEVHLVEGDGHLPDGVVAAEAVVVQDLEVQHPLHHLLVGEPCARDGGDEDEQHLGLVPPCLDRAAGEMLAPGSGWGAHSSMGHLTWLRATAAAGSGLIPTHGCLLGWEGASPRFPFTGRKHLQPGLDGLANPFHHRWPPCWQLKLS